MPALQEVVAMPIPTKPPTTAPEGCETVGISPTITSGPGIDPASGCDPPFWVRNGFITTDCAEPLTTLSISIGYMVARTEIFPTVEPASDNRPNDFANSSDTRS